eukprot:gene767-951_t
MSQILLNQVGRRQDIAGCIKEVFEGLEKEVAKLPRNSSEYRSNLVKVVMRYHELVELLSASKIQKKSTKYKDLLIQMQPKLHQLVKALETFLLLPDRLADITLKEAWLVQYHDPAAKITPKYTALRSDQLHTINRQVYESFSSSLGAINQQAVQVKEVNKFGKKISSYNLPYSIYHALTNKKLGDYMIVKFDQPMKPSQIPLFIRHEERIYRTDVLGGSKLQTSLGKQSYGSMIAIPLEASEFFKAWFTSEESFCYGQRAFLPEEANQPVQGLEGTFKIGVIPDTSNYVIQSPFIVKDGWGYIKKSIADKMLLTSQVKSLDVASEATSYLTYQALQYYSPYGKKEVVKELFNKEQLHSFKGQLGAGVLKDAQEMGTVYHHLIGSLPKYNLVGIPVSGESLILPTIYQKTFGNGSNRSVFIGRNPYSSPKLFPVEEKRIQFSKELERITAFQYTLSGYYKNKKEQGDQYIGSFFKGMLGVIDDQKWPEDLQGFDIVVSSKDQKLNQTWLNEDKKQADQSTQIRQDLILRGALVVKEQVEGSKLLGLPVAYAERLAGDYDGDQYDVIDGSELPKLQFMLTAASKAMIPNPKLKKTFTIRQQVGNLKKILELRKPLLERWTMISMVIFDLSAKEREELAQALAKDHVLEQVLGAGWKNSLGIEVSEGETLHLMLAEIQVGIKCGEDGPKTKVPFDLLHARAQVYEQALRAYRSQLAIKHGKGLRHRLEKAMAEGNNRLVSFLSTLEEALKGPKSKSIVGKVYRASVRYLTNDKEVDECISEDEKD